MAGRAEGPPRTIVRSGRVRLRRRATSTKVGNDQTYAASPTRSAPVASICSTHSSTSVERASTRVVSVSERSGSARMVAWMRRTPKLKGV